MLTAFREDGAIDWNGVDALTDWYIEAGAAGLFACCLSSEMYHLTEQERLELVRRVVHRANGRAPVVATGTFGGAIEQQAEFMKKMADTGVQAVVVITSQLAAPEAPDALFQRQLEELLIATDPIPLGFYECPTPYKRLLSPFVLRWAAQTGRFLYLKDTSCDLTAIQAKLEAIQPTRLGLFNAHQPTALESLKCSAAGVSPTAANFYPELFVWLCKHHQRQAAADLQERLNEMTPITTLQYPSSAKYFLQKRGLPITTRCRSRNERLTEETIAKLDALRIMAQEIRAC
jgi:4-hydroxy-tetrahydrodipicolinate synthase